MHKAILLVRSCGVFDLFWGVMHVAFFWLWKAQFAALSPSVAATLKGVNALLCVLFLTLAYLYLVHPREILTTRFARDLNIGMLVFWATRAIGPLVLLGFKDPADFAIFGVGSLAHGVVLWCYSGAGPRMSDHVAAQQPVAAEGAARRR